MSRMPCHARWYWPPKSQVLALLLLGLVGCGGGSQGSPPPSPDFSLAISPTSQSVDPGSSASVSLSATAIDGFSSQISVQVTGVPAGVTVSPTSITLVPGTPQQISFSAAANAADANATVTFTGTSGSLTHTTTLSLSVTAPDFSLAVSPTSQSVNAGGSASVSLSATALGGFSSQISVQVTGVPAGVSVSPTNITLVPGTPQQITLTAAASAPTANATVTFTGTSGSLTHTTSLSLTVNGSGNGVPTRTRYLRTDATTEDWLWVNQHWILYHAPTSRYFVTDPSSNEVIVIDAASETEIATIGVPGAFGIDETPDGTTLWVGTQIGDVYSIDPVGMTVIQRYIASGIGPYGYGASSALVLSDGQLALIGLYNGVDGAPNIAVWNPADNSITIYGAFGDGQGTPFPCGNFQGSLFGFALSVDRTQILLGNGGGLCEMNPSAGTGNFVSSGSSLHIVTTPDGKYIILPNYPSGVALYDTQTLAVVAQFNVLGDTSSASGFFVSADSTTLFTPDDAEAIIYAYSLATQQLVGWVPNIYVTPDFVGEALVFGPLHNPYLLATNGSGLFAGPMEEGVGFIDLSTLQTSAVGTEFTNGYLNPATGPVSGGTATEWENVAGANSLKSVYFGSHQATNISATPDYLNATSPAGNAGPADIYTFTTNGGMQLLPEAFSYGPTILEVTPNMSTAEGGGTGYIYGYGFGPVTSNSIPSGLTVTVDGVAAPVTAFDASAYPTSSPPFPLQSLAYTVPPGTNRSTANVVVTTSAGSAMATGALTYLSATQPFPLTSSTLAQGIYDSYTDLYYFTDTAEIQVFSRTQGKWLSPINIPPPKGTTQRLWGIALSPDGSKLAISDLNAGAIYLLNPANPTSVQTFIVGSQSPFDVNPCGLAISDAGNVYYMVSVLGQGGGADQFFKLNTNTGAITNYGIDGPGLGSNDDYLRNAISSDNTRVFYNEYGEVFSIDTATDTIVEALDGYGCCYGNYELALSSNQTQFTATFYIYDSDLNGESYYALNDREILNIAYVYGAKLSSDGRLLFQPSTNGIDVFDGNLGNLRDRISLPAALSPNYDALVDDGTDNVLVAITGTGNGIAIIDLTSVAEPGPQPYDNKVASSKHNNLSGRGNRLHGDSNVGVQPDKQNRRTATEIRAVPHITKTLLP
jgi:YVTN family beta-propeller protein